MSRTANVNRVYSQMTLKAVDDDRRIITGIASTPSTDRDGDVVEPKGAEYTLPIPLLWQHDHQAPVGNVVKARVTDNGIEIEAHMVVPTDDMPSQMIARLNEAWASVKNLLVRGLSIGFRGKEYAFLEDGIRFLRWDWYELSLVTVPAQIEATITSIKSFDLQQIAAIGTKSAGVEKTEPGDSGKKSPKLPVKVKKMNLKEQIKSFEEARAAKDAEMKKLMADAAEKGVTLDDEQEQEYDDLKAEIKKIDAHLARLKEAEQEEIKGATPATPGNTEGVEKGAKARGAGVIEVKSRLPEGIEFTRYVKSLAMAKGNIGGALEIAKAAYPEQHRIHNVLKAAVAAGTTTDPTWASPLVDYTNLTGEFIEFLRPATIIGRVPGLRRVPFNVNLPRQTSGGSAYWVGEGAPKPLTKFDFDNLSLGMAKVANIAVLTQELIRSSSPSAELLVRDQLAEAIIERLDIDFILPTKAAVSNVSPASITNGVTAVVSSGDVETDVEAVMAKFIAARISPTSGVWITDSLTALQLSNIRNALGQREYDTVTMTGGTFKGMPLIVSDYVPRNTAGGLLILVNASDILLADDGQVVIDASNEASLQMLDNPTNNSTGATTPTTVVSMFQTNSVAIRAERFINWTKRRAAAVAYVSGTDYSGT